MQLFKKVALFLIFLTTINLSYAQEISFRGGLNLSQMLIKSNNETNYENAGLMPGFLLGPVIEISKNNHIAFETGLFYTTKGIKEIGNYTADQKTLFRLNIAYLEVPLTIKISIPFQHVTLLANGGGYLAQGLFGHILSKEDINESHSLREKVIWGKQEGSFQRFDYGINFGIGMKYKTLQIGTYYENGIANLSGYNRTKTKVHNRVAGLYLSYVIWNKSKIRL